MSAASRQRVRRALRAPEPHRAQADSVRRLLQDDRRLLGGGAAAPGRVPSRPRRGSRRAGAGLARRAGADSARSGSSRRGSAPLAAARGSMAAPPPPGAGAPSPRARAGRPRRPPRADLRLSRRLSPPARRRLPARAAARRAARSRARSSPATRCGSALGGEGRDDEGHPGPDVAAVQGAAAEAPRARHHDAVRVAEEEVGAHPAELLEREEPQLVEPVVDEGASRGRASARTVTRLTMSLGKPGHTPVVTRPAASSADSRTRRRSSPTSHRTPKRESTCDDRLEVRRPGPRAPRRRRRSPRRPRPSCRPR